MRRKPRIPPVLSDNWSPNLNSLVSIFNPGYKRAFSYLKSKYGKELIKVKKTKTLLKDIEITKEERRIIKEKIKKQYKNQLIKNIFSFIVALILLFLIVYIVNNYLRGISDH